MTTQAAGSAGGGTDLPVAQIRRRLLEWYDAQGRKLPWRTDPHPYAVLVSEAMLQQTRVETVLPYFQQFMNTFPTLELLAAAEPEQVLKAWEGLGYYRRARHLHQTAREVAARYGGKLPQDPGQLRELPGLGRYTAAAVASIAYNVPVAAVDGNVVRVLARWLDCSEAMDRSRGRQLVTAAAQELVDPVRPGAFNQAMMDLGATVCRPRKPRCDICPVRRFCRARQAGDPERLPVKGRGRQAVPTIVRAAALIVDEEKQTVLLARRRPEGLLAGLWELPAVETRGAGAADGRIDDLLEYLKSWGLQPLRPAAADERALRHIFSHRRWQVWIYPVCIPTAVPARPFIKNTQTGEHDRLAWAGLNDLSRYTVPALFLPLLKELQTGF